MQAGLFACQSAACRRELAFLCFHLISLHACRLQGVPTSFLKCTDMVPIAASRNGACPTTITSNSETLSFYAGNLRRDAAFASTCPTPQ